MKIKLLSIIFLFNTIFIFSQKNTNEHLLNRTFICTGKLNANNKKDGEWKCFNKKDSLIINTNYHNGKKEGQWLAINLKKHNKIKGFYSNNKRNGLWTFYKQEKLTAKGEYKNNHRYGEWSFFGKYINEIGHYKYIEKEQIIDDGNRKSDIEKYLMSTFFSLINIEYRHKTGLWKTYSDNILISKGVYENGKKDSIWIDFYKSSEIKAKTTYSKGIPVKFISFHKNGDLKTKGIYKNNKKIGKWETFKNKKLIKLEEHINKKINVVNYYPSGEIKEKGTLVNYDKRDAFWYSYYENGSIKSKNEYSNGKIISLKSYYVNKALKFEKKYANNKIIEFKNYSKNETLLNEVMYSNKGVILDVFYNLDSTISSKEITKYENNDIIKKYTRFYRNGNIAETKTYINSKKEGEFNLYTIDGKLHSSKIYKNGKLIKK